MTPPPPHPRCTLCLAMNDYLKGVLHAGKCSALRCQDVMRLGEGCPHYASTPDAGARQRIADAVKELEKEEQDAIFRYTNATTMNEETYQQGIAFAYQQVIALLKDGVERK